MQFGLFANKNLISFANFACFNSLKITKMKITFHGAARTVTGSKHLIHINPDKNILLDCGLFQGMGADTHNMNEHWGFEPRSINYVIVSHAHIDHIGLLPKLVKDGYEGNIFCTPQTLDLAKVLLLDSAYIQESDVAFVNKLRAKQGRPLEIPLYTEADAEKVFPLLVPVPIDEMYKIDNDVELLFTECGHILGSAAVNLQIKENGKVTKLTFSGDIGRYGDLILRSPGSFPQADVIIMESTYGNKLHDVLVPPTDKLLKYIIETCIGKRGKLIIPAFSVGRTQELLFLLNRLELENRLPDLKYFVDSPLSIESTEVVKRHPECFNKTVQELLLTDYDVFSFKGLQYLKSATESMSLNDFHEPCVIISASGMAEAGRVKHHIVHNIDNHKNTILFAGYCEPHSMGGKLKSGAKNVSIYGVHHDVAAEIGVIESLSAHADYDDLCLWLSCQNPAMVRKLFIVHGEYETQIAFRERLLRKGFTDIDIPDLHQEFGIGE